MKRLAIALLPLILPHAAHAIERHVTPNGSPSSDCSPGAPCTIQRAANIVNPGDVVLVADGTYSTGPTGYILTSTRGGTPTNKVTFKAVNKWGARLSGRPDTSLRCIRVEANYVRVENFDISEFRYAGVYNVSGNFFELVGNHIHDIARTLCSSDNIGRNGYYSQGTTDILIEGNLLHDIGRLSVGENGCGTSLDGNDHGLYMSGSRISVRNNIFYNIRAGWAIQLYPSSSTDVSIYGNTFCGYFQAGTKVGQITIGPPGSNVRIANNIFSQPRKYLIHMGNSTTTGEFFNNLTDVAISGVFSISQAGVVTGGNIVNVSPGFAGVTVSGGLVSGTPDFHLLSGSPAIDAGLPLAEVTRDYDGNPRPQGAGYDLGCYEYMGLGPDVVRPAQVTDLGPF